MFPCGQDSSPCGDVERSLKMRNDRKAKRSFLAFREMTKPKKRWSREHAFAPGVFTIILILPSLPGMLFTVEAHLKATKEYGV